jgi:hypothetical protein
LARVALTLQILFMSFAFGGIPAVRTLSLSMSGYHSIIMLLDSVLLASQQARPLLALHEVAASSLSHLCLREKCTPIHVLTKSALLFICLQYEGRTLAAAHAPLVRNKGLNLTHFDAVSMHRADTTVAEYHPVDPCRGDASAA